MERLLSNTVRFLLQFRTYHLFLKNKQQFAFDSEKCLKRAYQGKSSYRTCGNWRSSPDRSNKTPLVPHPHGEHLYLCKALACDISVAPRCLSQCRWHSRIQTPQTSSHDEAHLDRNKVNHTWGTRECGTYPTSWWQCRSGCCWASSHPLATHLCTSSRSQTGRRIRDSRRRHCSGSDVLWRLGCFAVSLVARNLDAREKDYKPATKMKKSSSLLQTNKKWLWKRVKAAIFTHLYTHRNETDTYREPLLCRADRFASFGAVRKSAPSCVWQRACEASWDAPFRNESFPRPDCRSKTPFSQTLCFLVQAVLKQKYQC